MSTLKSKITLRGARECSSREIGNIVWPRRFYGREPMFNISRYFTCRDRFLTRIMCRSSLARSSDDISVAGSIEMLHRFPFCQNFRFNELKCKCYARNNHYCSIRTKFSIFIVLSPCAISYVF